MSDSIQQLRQFEELRREAGFIQVPGHTVVDVVSTYVPIIAPGSQN